MTESVFERLRAVLEEYRGQMEAGRHPKELPDRVLDLLRDVPAEAPVPDDLAPLHRAAARYRAFGEELSEGDTDPDPLEIDMVFDEFVGALCAFYEPD